MPKVIITVEDAIRDGVEGVTVLVDTEPRLNPESQELVEITPALKVAIAISEMANSGELVARSREIFDLVSAKGALSN